MINWQKIMKKIFLLYLMCFLVLCNCTNKKLEIYEDENTGYYGIRRGSKIIIPAKYDRIYSDGYEPFSSDNSETEFLITAFKDNKWQRINQKGETVFYAMFYDNGADYYEQGLARFVTKNNKVGFHDYKGNIVIPAKYNWAGYIGLIDDKDITTEKKYTYVCNGCYILSHSTKMFPSSSGALHEAIDTSGFYHPEIIGGKWGVIDIAGNEVVPLEYKDINSAKQELKSKLYHK